MNAANSIATANSLAQVDTSMTGTEVLALFQGHFQQNLNIYIGICIVLLPFAIIFRRWSIPLVIYVIELSAYLTVMHVVLRTVIRVAAWFKDQSSMNRAFGTESESPGWTTPLFEVWNLDAYFPKWVVFLEIGFLVVVVILMWKIRPLKPQKRGKKIEDEKQRTGSSTIHKYKQGGE